jgi:hypothetical protein
MTLKLDFPYKSFIEKDRNMIDAIRSDINIGEYDNIDKMAEVYLKCDFQNHIVGRGANHIWVARKSDGDRIATITA